MVSRRPSIAQPKLIRRCIERTEQHIADVTHSRVPALWPRECGDGAIASRVEYIDRERAYIKTMEKLLKMHAGVIR